MPVAKELLSIPLNKANRRTADGHHQIGLAFNEESLQIGGKRPADIAAASAGEPAVSRSERKPS
jgi:hypothetical protein